MPVLKEVQKQIPGGFQFFVPQTNWKPAPFSSIDSIAQQLIQHRRGRPDLVAKHGWSLDLGQVTAEVTAYQVEICVQNGWNDYLLGGGEGTSFFPPPQPSLLNRVRSVAGGAEVIIDWLKSGAEAVPSELSNNRAQTCSTCPMNQPGGFESWFTVPVSKAIRAAVEHRKEMNLSTSFDDQLQVCSVCLCPIKLKVHLDINRLLRDTPKATHDAFPQHCWIITEEKALK